MNEPRDRPAHRTAACHGSASSTNARALIIGAALQSALSMSHAELCRHPSNTVEIPESSPASTTRSSLSFINLC